MKKRILIIDNDKQLNLINQKILLKSGYVSELHIVENGADALDYLVNRVNKGYPLPDIIVFDVHLPVMDGLSFVEEFQQLDFNGKTRIELVAFTYSSNPRQRDALLQKGVTHFLIKPYLLRGLTDIIQRQLHIL